MIHLAKWKCQGVVDIWFRRVEEQRKAPDDNGEGDEESEKKGDREDFGFGGLHAIAARTAGDDFDGRTDVVIVVADFFIVVTELSPARCLRESGNEIEIQMRNQ